MQSALETQLRERIVCLEAMAWKVVFEVVHQGFSFQIDRGKEESEQNHQDTEKNELFRGQVAIWVAGKV